MSGPVLTPTMLLNARVITPEAIIDPGAIQVAGGRIQAIGRAGDLAIPHKSHALDLRGRTLIPGLIDLHLHGLEGHDVAGPGLSQIIQRLPARGVTAFLATTYVFPRDRLLGSLAQIADVLSAPPFGAVPLGIHMEGPWLSPARSGLADPELCRPMDRADLDVYLEAGRGLVRMITLAPESGNGLELIPHLRRAGIHVAAGHTDAPYDVGRSAIEHGCRHASHLFNAMRPFHHRDPGVIGAVLEDRRVFAHIIGDGHHLHPAVVRFLLSVKGPGGFA